MFKTVPTIPGDIIQIPLTKEHYGFAQIIGKGGHYIAIFDFCGDINSTITDIISCPVLFREELGLDALIGGRWKVIGSAELSEEVESVFEFCSCTEYPPSINCPEGEVFYTIEKIDCRNKALKSTIREASEAECEGIRESSGFLRS